MALVLLGLLALLGTGPQARADGGGGGGGTIKVFVVKDPAVSGGQLATLQSVAAGTLGDAARAGEIFTLNRSLAQPDGAALTDPGEPLHPGWILRLPDDASGPDVQLARDTSTQQAAPPPAGQGGAPAPPPAAGQPAALLTLPLPAVVAGAGAVLLALVTTGIVARRRVGRGLAALRRAVHRLGGPARRRRRLLARRALGARFAADAETVRRAIGTLAEFAPTRHRAETPVHALRVDGAGVTVWVPSADTLEEPWQNIADTRWRRPSTTTGWLERGGTETGSMSLAALDAACLVRVGADDDGEPVFVDMSRLDGVLSVTGDDAVARDVVRNLLAEVARSRPRTPVTVLRAADGTPPLAVPAALQEVTRIEPGGTRPPEAARRTVVGAAARRPVKGLVVVAGTPTGREAAELAALCGPGGAGWTGLVCGEANGAHWRWYTDAHGSVRIPVLGTRLTVPA
ncbi:hypothetical protein [Streptomyces sulfonofaciens]|uniref:hypothetical protein n=1 Tax=Streptomyces sulfonofaciens TaxID=68272 RepID=UPI001672269B|nr:hypothetical protein [Streptomyces sulfonofaciens]